MIQTTNYIIEIEEGSANSTLRGVVYPLPRLLCLAGSLWDSNL